MKIKIQFQTGVIVNDDKEVFSMLFPTIQLKADSTGNLWLIPSDSDFTLEVDDKNPLGVIDYYLENWACEYKHDPESNMKVLAFY